MIKKKYNRRIAGLTLRERFLNKIQKVDSGCWEWSAALNTLGYGAIVDAIGTTKAAHRISYQIYIGDIPARMCVCHKCDNPKCVSPFHLFLGTHSDNMRDRSAKGRYKGPYDQAIHPSTRHYNLGCRCSECKKLKSDKGKIDRARRF